MKKLFIEGGPVFMTIITVFFILTLAWIIYHFIIAYGSKQAKQERLLRKIGYGRSMGLFTMVTGIYGQMTGLYYMFLSVEDAIEKGIEVVPPMIYGAIRVTMICPLYGILIFLLSFILSFVATTILERKFKTV